MGVRGPVPKRSTEVMGHRGADDPRDDVEIVSLEETVEVPEPPPGLHPIAQSLYDSVARSGQAQFYEPSDWAIVGLVAESISRDLKPQPIGVNEETGEPVMAKVPLKGASLAAYLKAFSSLMLTEGDRRRMKIEIERGKPQGLASVTQITDTYGAALG